jgi:hypothetical protein
MKRLFPEHFKKNGTAKVSYPSREAALRGITWTNVNAYKCPYCQGWHRGRVRVA